MKLLTMLGIMVVIFTSCAVLTPQETQQERFRLIEAYNEARERHNPEKVKEAVKDFSSANGSTSGWKLKKVVSLRR